MGLWIGEAEGAKFWLGVLTELKNRGLKDILIAAVDGLKGFPEAIEAVYPKTQIQLCIVHLKWRATLANLTPFFDYPPEIHGWPTALNHLSLVFQGRLPV